MKSYSCIIFVWLLLCSWHSFLSLHVAVLFHFHSCVIFYCNNLILFSTINRYVISIEQLQILCKNIYTCFAVYTYSFLLDVNLRVRLLINRVCSCSALVNSAKLCPEWLYQITFLPARSQFSLLYFFCQYLELLVFLILIHSHGCITECHWAWTYIYLMTSEVEHLFPCLLGIWISSFLKCLFKSFALF